MEARHAEINWEIGHSRNIIKCYYVGPPTTLAGRSHRRVLSRISTQRNACNATDATNATTDDTLSFVINIKLL